MWGLNINSSLEVVAYQYFRSRVVLTQLYVINKQMYTKFTHDLHVVLSTETVFKSLLFLVTEKTCNRFS